MKTIKVNNDECIGCMSCVLACSLKKTNLFSYDSAVIKVEGKESRGLNYVLSCSNCTDRKCIEVCPVDAINMEENYGIPIIDYDKCISCGLCVEHCTYGIIRIENQSDKVYKCDLCGGNPVCVENCIPGALTIEVKEVK